MKLRKIKSQMMLMAAALLSLAWGGCSKSQSYSELLREEEQAVNWYLAGQNVELELPEDPKDMITSETAGEDAPFYRINDEGYVYMQVVKADFDEMVEKDEVVYFRFSRSNIIYLSQGIDVPPTGNSDALGFGPASFVYKNTNLSSSTTWGEGIQLPLKYLGYNSEVNLVIKSYFGFADEQSSCVPYLMNIRYFRPEY